MPGTNSPAKAKAALTRRGPVVNLLNSWMVERVLSYHGAGSRTVRITGASGNASMSSPKKEQDGQSTATPKSAKNPSQSTSFPAGSPAASQNPTCFGFLKTSLKV